MGGACGRLLLVALVLSTTGCALRGLDAPVIELELVDTPFFPQREWHCGPAALASVLVHAGVDIEPDQLVPHVYLPARQGSLQIEMIAAARQAGRLPYLLDSDVAAIEQALGAGYPVLVLQNLGSVRWPRWHYAVVIGREARGRWLLRSGSEFRQRMPDRRFRALWDRGGRWAMVALGADSVPAFASSARWVDAAAGFEAVGLLDPAESAYRAALKRWPDSFSARLGLGNIAYMRGNREVAARHYRLATEAAPAHPAGWNNLATVLGELGCTAQALDALSNGEAVVTTEFEDALAETRRGLQRASSAECPDQIR